MEFDATTHLEDRIDEAFAAVPEEIQDFLVSKELEIIIAGIKKTLSLNENQINDVRIIAYKLLLDIADYGEVADYLAKKSYPKEIIGQIIYAVETEIITRAVNIVKGANEEDLEKNLQPAAVTQPSVTRNAPTPADALASIKDRLTQASAVTPVKRDYTTAPQKTNTPAPNIDPYREIPE